MIEEISKNVHELYARMNAQYARGGFGNEELAKHQLEIVQWLGVLSETLLRLFGRCVPRE